MTFAKFSNPYLTIESYEPASRSELFCATDKSSHPIDQENIDHEAELDWLQRHLRRSIVVGERGGVDADQRNKTTSKDGVSSIVFRLISTSNSPQTISLDAKPPKSLRVIEREYEDTDEEHSRRRRRAEDVAVDFSQLREQARISYAEWPTRNESKKHQLAKLKTYLSPEGNILIMNPSGSETCPEPLARQTFMHEDSRRRRSLSVVGVALYGQEDGPRRRKSRLRATHKRKTPSDTQ